MSDLWRTWMPLDIGRYLKDTTHLSTLEHGAYLLLIMHYWNKGSLPTEDKQLAAIVRLSTRQWMSIKATMAAFFRPDWSHKKIEKELEVARTKYEKRAQAGHRGGTAKAENEAKARLGRSIATNNADSNASSNEPPNATHNTHNTSSNEEVWVDARKRMCRAFERAGRLPPDMSWTEIWRSRGYDPQICAAVVEDNLSRNPTVRAMKWFDQPVADAHVRPQGNARAGPSRPPQDGRQQVLDELRDSRNGQRDYHDETRREADDPDWPAGARLERLP